VDMVERCGLNRLNQFATFLTTHLKNSRTNPKLVTLLAGLDEVLYSGLPLAREEEEWAYRNRINLKVRPRLSCVFIVANELTVDE